MKGLFLLSKMVEQPSYYAVIPANVRYSKDVSSGAKLLYGEITCLCNAKGYCWATNSYFAELYTASNKTISRWISELAKAGFIASIVDDASGNSRKIWLAQPVIDTTDLSIPMDKNVHTPRQKRPYPMDKNVQHNNRVNNKGNNKSNSVETPAQKTDFSDFVFPDLEEKKETPPVPAAPSFVHHSDRPRCELHTELIDALRLYYKTNPFQWTESIQQQCPGMYTNEQLGTFLVAYAEHAFADRNPNATYAQHHAKFCTWVRTQKNFTAKTQTFARPASNKMRTVEVREHNRTDADQLF